MDGLTLRWFGMLQYLFGDLLLAALLLHSNCSLWILLQFVLQFSCCQSWFCCRCSIFESCSVDIPIVVSPAVVLLQMYTCHCIDIFHHLLSSCLYMFCCLWILWYHWLFGSSALSSVHVCICYLDCCLLGHSAVCSICTHGFIMLTEFSSENGAICLISSAVFFLFFYHLAWLSFCVLLNFCLCLYCCW